MENCPKCAEISTMYETIGKTYYRLDEKNVLCYRHWHQTNRPKFVDRGDYDEIFSKQSIAKAKEAIAKEAREKNDEKKHKAPERVWDGF